MKIPKTPISEKPFKLLGYTLEEYLLWCKKHNLKSYTTESKRVFFKKVNEYQIVKVNNKIYENGEEIK